MSSSEISDSRRIHGGRSNFSQTCSLLSQYLKEKRSFGDLTLGLTPTSESKGAPTETMNLLSMIENSGRNLNSPPAASFAGGKEEIRSKPEAETAPMTIFYAGQVIVLNDFPADKAKEIIALASKSASSSSSAPPLAAPSTAESTSAVPNIVPPSFASASPPLDSDLPIARKNSLARFLEKRRDRITANAPYPVTAKAAAAPPPKQVKAEPWLGLSQRN